MVMLDTLIQFLYPQAVNRADYILQNEGEGDYIFYWNEETLGPVPTETQLAQAETDYLAQALLLFKRKGRHTLLEEIALFYEAVLGEPMTPELVGTWTNKKLTYDRWAAAGKPTPDPATYPVAEGERLEFIPVLSLAQMLQLWGDKHGQLVTLMAAVEPIRRRAMNGLEAATTEAEAESALNTARSALAQMGT